MDPESLPGPQRGGNVAPGLEPRWLATLRRAVRIDFTPRYRPPSAVWAVVATVLSVAGSLGLDELCVHGAVWIWPSLRGYPHFQFSDYATLSVIGVAIACAGWPIMAYVSSSPRWLFLRAAVVTTLVLWLPDAWLLARGEPARAVAVLMVMHLGIALVTYNVLVRVARLRPSPRADTGPLTLSLTESAVRRIWSSMAALVAVELALGVVTIVSVPFTRPNAVLPTRGTTLYAAHGVVGIALAAGAVVVLLLSSRTARMARVGALIGAVGVGVGLAGGVCATFQSTRLLGMGVMMLGVLAAGVGYLVPSLDAMGRAEATRAAATREAMAQRRPHATTGPAVQRADQEVPSVDGHGELDTPSR
ncbi:MAG: hypothetical protein ACRDWE_01165 [Acidimicrobiales bacterium]